MVSTSGIIGGKVKEMPRTKGANTYSNEYLIKRIHKHLVEDRASIYTLHKPVWTTYANRMKKDADFADKVKDCIAEGNFVWEQLGLSNMEETKEGFNLGLYKHFTQNKRSFLPYETLELEERLTALEEARDGK